MLSICIFATPNVNVGGFVAKDSYAQTQKWILPLT